MRIAGNGDGAQSQSLQVWLVLAAATGLRLVYLLLYSQLSDWNMLTVDNWYHLNWAGSIADGNLAGDTTYFRAPFYVYILALLRAVFGESLWVFRLYGTAVGIASVWLTYLIGRRLFGRSAGLVAAWLHALSPIALYFDGELLLDPTFTLLLELTVYRGLIWLETKRSLDLLYTGLACGLSAITRPTSLAFALVLVATAMCQGSLRDRLRNLALLALGLGICILPITIRNVMVARDPVLIASQDGINLYIGNNEAADGLTAAMPEPMGTNWQISQITHIAEIAEGRELKPGEVSGYWRRLALVWMMEHPLDFITLFGRKLYHQVLNLEISNNRSLGSFFHQIPLLRYNPLTFGLVFALAALALAAGAWRARGAGMVLALMLALMAVTSLFFFTSRFRLPLVPFWCTLAGYGLIHLWHQLTNASWRTLVRSAAILATALLISFLPLLRIPSGVVSGHLTSAGLYAFRSGDIGEALRLFEAVASRNPDQSEVHLNLGACYLRLGDTASARLQFERELALHPERHKVYQNLATLALVRGDFEAARTQARRATTLAPYDITAQIVLLRTVGADTSYPLDRLRVAIDSVRVATGDNLRLLNEAGVLLSSRGDGSGAERILRAALLSQPPPVETDDAAFSADFPHSRARMEHERARTFYQLGYLTGLAQRFDQAAGYSRLAIAQDSSLAEAYVNLASACLSLGETAEASAVLREAVNRFPDHATVNELAARAGVSKGTSDTHK